MVYCFVVTERPAIRSYGLVFIKRSPDATTKTTKTTKTKEAIPLLSGLFFMVATDTTAVQNQELLQNHLAETM